MAAMTCRNAIAFRKAMLVGTALLTSAPLLSAQAEDVQKWGAHIELEGKIGTDRHLGESMLFLPLLQDDNSMLFLDARGKLDNNSSREVNIGLGYRHILENDMILGGYGFFDRRRSPEGNMFNQATLGTELLTDNFDLRANAYRPFGETVKSAASYDNIELSGASIVMREGQEKALNGFDAEIGYTLPALHLIEDQSDEFRVYAGGYHFWEDGVDNVSGPRLRAEYRINDVLTTGSRMSLTGEFQHDDPRGEQGFLGFRIRFPLQPETARRTAGLSRIEQRMTETIIRDVDVVAQAGAFGAPVAGVDADTGETLSDLHIIADKDGASLKSAIESAPTTKTTYVRGDGRLDVADTVNLQAGQSVRGSFRVVHPTTGREMSFGNTHVHGTDASKNVFAMADNTTLMGMTVSGGLNGVHSDGASNVTLNNVTVRQTANIGINFENGSNFNLYNSRVENLDFDNADGFQNANPDGTQTAVGLRLAHADDVTVRNYSADYIGMGIVANDSDDLDIRDSTITRSRKEGMLYHYVHNATLDNITIDKTGADGAAFIVSADVDFTNSRLTNMGAMNPLGNYSGVNISGFTSDPTVIVGATENKNYHFSNLKITNVSNSGMMLQELRDSSFTNISIKNAEIIGIQVMRMMRDVENLSFNDVTIDNAQNAGFWMMGDMSDIDADITTTNTATPCGRSPFMAANLTQNGGQQLRINGGVIAPADVTTACGEASNF